jgi:hypothetical protein
MEKQNIFIILFVFFFMLGAFALQYYMNNNNFDKFVQENKFNVNFDYDKYNLVSENNLKYNIYLKIILIASIIICIFVYFLFELDKSLHTKLLNTNYDVYFNGESQGESTGGKEKLFSN